LEIRGTPSNMKPLYHSLQAAIKWSLLIIFDGLGNPVYIFFCLCQSAYLHTVKDIFW
jgi:hypothetical protein